MPHLGYHDVERMALQYVLEDEIWPGFVAWVGMYAKTTEATKWALCPDPGLDELRELYVAHIHYIQEAIEAEEETEGKWSGS